MKRWKQVLLGVAATGAVLAPAIAAPPYWVTAGGVSTGDEVFFGTLSGQGSYFAVNHSGSITPLGCDDASIEGKIHTGASSGGHVLTMTAVNRVNTPETFSGIRWSGCRGPVGFALTIQPVLTRELWLTGTSTTANTDVIAGQLTGGAGGPFTVRVYGTGAPASCDFTVTGVMDVLFDEAAQTLTIKERTFTGNLYVSSIAGGGSANCFGLVGVGDPIDVEATFGIGPDVLGNDDSGISVPFPLHLEP